MIIYYNIWLDIIALGGPCASALHSTPMYTITLLFILIITLLFC